MIKRATALRIARMLLQPMVDAGMCGEEQVRLAATIVESEIALDELRKGARKDFECDRIASRLQ